MTTQTFIFHFHLIESKTILPFTERSLIFLTQHLQKNHIKSSITNLKNYFIQNWSSPGLQFITRKIISNMDQTNNTPNTPIACISSKIINISISTKYPLDLVETPRFNRRRPNNRSFITFSPRRISTTPPVFSSKLTK